MLPHKKTEAKSLCSLCARKGARIPGQGSWRVSNRGSKCQLCVSDNYCCVYVNAQIPIKKVLQKVLAKNGKGLNYESNISSDF